jgi:hypothetical protein
MILGCRAIALATDPKRILAALAAVHGKRTVDLETVAPARPARVRRDPCVAPRFAILSHAQRESGRKAAVCLRHLACSVLRQTLLDMGQDKEFR